MVLFDIQVGEGGEEVDNYLIFWDISSYIDRAGEWSSFSSVQYWWCIVSGDIE